MTIFPPQFLNQGSHGHHQPGEEKYLKNITLRYITYFLYQKLLYRFDFEFFALFPQHIAFSLQLKLVEAFESFMKQLVSFEKCPTKWSTIISTLFIQIKSCNMPEELASIPLVSW